MPQRRRLLASESSARRTKCLAAAYQEIFAAANSQPVRSAKVSRQKNRSCAARVAERESAIYARDRVASISRALQTAYTVSFPWHDARNRKACCRDRYPVRPRRAERGHVSTDLRRRRRCIHAPRLRPSVSVTDSTFVFSTVYSMRLHGDVALQCLSDSRLQRAWRPAADQRSQSRRLPESTSRPEWRS